MVLALLANSRAATAILPPTSHAQMARLALCTWPWLAARHAILDVIGCLLTNRCQVEKLLFYG
jgi:hypothetical protein